MTNALVDFLNRMINADEKREAGRYIMRKPVKGDCPRCKPASDWPAYPHSGTCVWLKCGHTISTKEYEDWFIEPAPPGPRAVAEVAFKRAIIERITSQGHYYCEDPWYSCGAHEECADHKRSGECDCGRDDYVRDGLLLLAAVYADQPGYAEAIRG